MLQACDAEDHNCFKRETSYGFVSTQKSKSLNWIVSEPHDITSNPDRPRTIACYAAPTFIAATWKYTPPEMYWGLQNVSVSTRVPPVLVAACFAADHITVSMAIYPTARRARGSQSLSTWHSLPHCPGKFSNPRRESKVALPAALTWSKSWRHVVEPLNVPAYIGISRSEL